jgi:hypothetical protein
MDAVFFEELHAAKPHVAPAAITSIERVAQQVRELGETGNKGDEKLPTRRIFELSRRDLSQVTDVLTPRVMELSTDTVMVQRLLEFGRAIRRWELARYLEDSDERAGDDWTGEIVWAPIAEALDATAAIFGRIDEIYAR